jgi:DUF4097 and DUF4098 domain-containing protein YvlB
MATISSLILEFTETTQTCTIEERYNSIEIDVNTHDVDIYLSETSENKVVYTGNEKVYVETKIEDGVLKIEQFDERKFYEKIMSFNDFGVDLYLSIQTIDSLSINGTTCDIEIHQGFTFENVDIDLTTGDLRFLSNVTNAMNIETTTGDIELLGVKCGELTIDIGTGDTELEDVIVVSDFYFECNTGDLVLEGFDAANIYIKANTGDVKGTILSSKFFIVNSKSGKVNYPETREGGECKITTNTGDINIRYK